MMDCNGTATLSSSLHERTNPGISCIEVSEGGTSMAGQVHQPSQRAVSQKQADSQKGSDEAGAWILPAIVAAIPLLGVLVFVVLRGAYSSVYSRLGFRPEDVGIDYFTVLAGAARIFRLGNWEPYGKPAVAVLCAIAFLVAAFTALRALQKRQYLPKVASRPVGFFMLYVVIILILALSGISYFAGRDGGRALSRIREGARVRPGNLHFLSVQAYHARLMPLDAGTVNKIGDSQGLRQRALFTSTSLMYLGHADGHVALYDYRTLKAWRIPDNIIVEVQPCHGKDGELTDCDW
jgi:hypothetical protein